MANKINLLFWIHRSKKNKYGKVPLMLRLSFQSHKLDRATGFHVNAEDWNTQRQKLKGKGVSIDDVNNFVSVINNKFLKLSREAFENQDVHLPTLMDRLFLKNNDDPTLLLIISEHVDNLKARVGKDYRYSTYEKYVFMKDKVEAFLKFKKITDLRLKDLRIDFIIDFDHYLRTEEDNQHNTATKYLLNLKRVINVAVMRGYLPSNPFSGYKTAYKDIPQVYLNQQELELVKQASLQKLKLELARDLFLFQCYTGLAYTDLISLEARDISEEEGQKWLIKARQKTSIIATIPLLPEALTLIEKYGDHPKNGKYLFPKYSIQKYNEYLFEIGNLSGVNKRISSHVGRRTFGNIALSKGISLNVISKILGHANTLITQRIYAITTQKIISMDLNKWNSIGQGR